MVESRSEFNTPEYWQELGMFVQRFAEAEFEAYTLLWILTNTDLKIPAAIYPTQMRLDDVMTSLRRLYPLLVAPHEDVRVCTRVLDQLKVISGVRNKLLHNGATFTETGAVVVKRLDEYRKGEKNVEQHPVPLEALNAMAQDCKTASGVMFAQGMLGMSKASEIANHYDVESWAYQPGRFS